MSCRDAAFVDQEIVYNSSAQEQVDDDLFAQNKLLDPGSAQDRQQVGSGGDSTRWYPFQQIGPAEWKGHGTLQIHGRRFSFIACFCAQSG